MEIDFNRFTQINFIIKNKGFAYDKSNHGRIFNYDLDNLNIKLYVNIAVIEFSIDSKVICAVDANLDTDIIRGINKLLSTQIEQNLTAILS